MNTKHPHQSKLVSGRAASTLIRALEPRIMFDGAAIATAVDAAHTDAKPAGLDAPDHHLAPPPVVHTTDLSALATPVTLDATKPAAEIVFIDGSLPDAQQLQDGVKPGIEVVILDPNRNGLDQIADHLEGREGIDAIHIVSHGHQGEITLGGFDLNQSSLNQQTETLTRIGNSLSADGDILLYGCQVGGGEVGNGFITQLAALTNADIAASIDNTGNSNLLADWTLETTTGAIEHDTPFTADLLADYQHVLPTTLVAGDIAVIGLNADDDDLGADVDGDGKADIRWAIMTMVDLDVGTVIHITDAGIKEDGTFYANAANEGHLTWTITTAVSAGTVLVMDTADGSNSGDLNGATAGTGGLSDYGTVSGGIGGSPAGGNTTAPSAGDQIIVYQGTASTTVGATFIYALNTAQNGLLSGNGVWQTSGTVTTQQQSFLPTGLTNGTTALALTTNVSGTSSSSTSGAPGAPNYGFDNMVYQGTLTGTKAQLLAAIGNPSNWAGHDTAPFNIGVGGSFSYASDFTIVQPNAAPAIGSLNADTVAWAGVGNTVTLDNGGNASLTDAELGALNGGNGDWSGASLSVQRPGTAISADTFAFNTTGALFSVSGNNLLSSGQTFATFTNTGGVLTINFNSALAPATTALVNDVARHITYRNDTPSGDTAIRFTLSDGAASTTADVTVASDSIYVTNTTDTATINVANGVSFSEAIAIAAADATGSQTIVFSSSLASTALSINSVTLNESLTFDMDAANGMSLTTGTITLGAATTQTFTNGTSDTATISSVITGSGALTKSGAGDLTLSATNTYSGATTISAGTLTVSGGDAIASASSVAVASGATFALSSNETVGNLSGAGAISLGSNTLTTLLTADTTFSGGIGGTGGLNVNQSGAATFALTLTGTNTFSGLSSLVNYGWLRLNGDASYSNSSALSVNGNSRLTLLSDQTVGSISSNSATASLDLGTFTLSAGGDNTSRTVAGVISGTGNLVKQGSGTLTLAGTNTYGGTTTISAGTLSVASDSNLGSNSVTLASGATLDVTGATTIDNAIALSGDATISNSANATLSGVISGANTLTKAGASTLTLSGTNTYAATTVNAGTLSVASDANLGSGAVTLATGSTLAITGATNIDNGIVLSGNATVSNSANATLSGVISGANTLTKTGASALTLSGTNTYAGTTVTAGTLRVADDSNLGNGSISLAGGTTLAVTGVTTIDNAITLAGNATVSTSANTTLSGAIGGGSNLNKAGASTLTLSGTNTYGGTTTISVGTLSVAADSNLGNGGLTLAAGTTLAVTGATTIDNALILSGPATVNTTADATLSGNIGGIGSLTKTGANTLTLSGSNSYAGTTTVSTGTLSVASDGNLGDDAITLASGTTFAITGSTTIDNAITLSGDATVQVANAVTLDGVISGAGGLTKTGAGTLTLANTNSFTGNVAVSAGGLTLSNGAALDNSSAVSLSSGTTLTLTSSEAIGSLAGSGTVTLGASTLGVGGNGSSTSFSGVIGGSGGLTKTGAGTLTLSGTNTYTGNTTISAGSIDAQNGAAIADTGAVNIAASAFLVLSAAETIGSLAGSGGVTLGANTLTTGGNNTSTTFSGVFSGSGDLVKVGSGTQVLAGTGSVGSMSGGMTLSGGVLSISTDSQLSSGTITLNGGTLRATALTTVDNAIVLAADSTINTQSYLALDGVVSGSGNLTKTGTSTLVLNAANTYTGTTYITTGYAHIKNSDSLGTSAGGTTVSSGAVLYFNGSANISDAITLGGTGINPFGAIYVQTGTSTISGAVTLTANTTMNVDGSSSLIFSGGITDGAGSYSLTKGGSGTLGLTGAGNYDGTTAINNGTLTLASDSNLGAGALTLGSGATLAITGATNIDNAIVLSGGTATVTNSANATLSGNITGSGGFIKAGASALSLSGTDSYTGATSVSAGSLLVNGALSGTSDTTVASGATLGGSGSISNNVTVSSGGTLSPGNSAGIITVNGNLTMASGSTLALEINGATAGTGYDQVIVNGAVDVSGATLAVTHGYTPGSGDTYNIIVNDAADAVTGSFSGISEGATLTAGGNSTVLTTSYIGATGNDITLTAPLNPTVTSVTATDPDGTYKIGDTITIGVTFSEPVYLSTGTLQLTLETGTTDRTITYVSGSGSSTIYFSYTVQAGDSSLDLDYASVSALVANGDTIQSGAFIDASLALPTPGAAGSLAANQAIVIDGVRPTAGIVVADTALAAGETSLVTITFSEAVSGLANADFTVANGALSGLATSDGGITWTATLTPTVAVTNTSNLITLDNTGVTDAAGNTGTGTTDSNNYAIDTARPTASIVVADTALAAGETSLVTITFSEAVTGFTNVDLTIANGALSTVSSSDGGITWTATFTPTADLTNTANLIILTNTGVQDAAGNTGTGTTDSNNYAIDTARPTASIVVADTALAAGETSLVTITFSEAVTGLDAGDFTVANGTLGTVTTSDGGVTWTGTFTPTASIENTSNLITLTNTGVQDAAGNTGTGTTDSNNYAIDTLRPTATIVVANTALAAGETSLVTITFSEAISGLTNADFTVANGALSGLATSDSGVTWTATLTPTAAVTNTSNLITLDNTGLTDVAGNTGTGTTDSNNYAIDTARPTASIVVADTALAAGETSLVTITFSEAVTGFTNADLTIANGALSTVNSSDGGITWTATFTPTADITSTTNVITLANSGVQDAAGNAGAGSTGSNNYAIDTLRPTATIVVADTALAAGETSLVTITMSEAVANFDSADLTVANGSLSNLATSDGGITWTAILTPTAGITDTTNVITFNSTGVIDGAGNIGAGAIDSNNYAIDTARPTATIVVADSALAVGETSLVTITFSEAVTGFTNADLAIANGTLSNVISSDGGITWTATFTPTAGITDTTNLITLDNTGVQDAAGNAGTGTTDSNNYVIDALAPTVGSVSVPVGVPYNTGDVLSFTVNTSEVVVVNTAGGTPRLALDIGGSTVFATYAAGSGTTTLVFQYTVQAGDTDANGISVNNLQANNGTLRDLAGNNLNTTLNNIANTDNVIVDTTAPTTTSIVVADTSLIAGETSTVTITFNEAVTGVDAGDFTVANGILSELSSSDGGITWTAKLTPAANTADTTNIITLNNAGITDIAGNAGAGVINSDNYAIDTQVPSVTSVSVPPGVPYNAGDVLSFTVNTSENVLVNTAGGTPRLALTIGGTTVFANYVAGSNTNTLVFQYTVKAGDNSSISVGSLSANGATLRDAAGNNLNAALTNIGSTAGISIDTTAPTVSSLTLQGTPSAYDKTVNFVVTFNEAVNQVDLSDFSLNATGNATGTLSGVQQIDNLRWQITVSDIEGDGTLGVNLKDTTDITDTAGNKLAGGFTSSGGFTAQPLPPPPPPVTPLAPLVIAIDSAPTQTQAPAPLIVLSPDATSIGGATNNTPLTTVEAPALATVVNTSLIVSNASTSPTSLDTSTVGSDPIGVATATNSGTPNPQSGLIHLGSSNNQAIGRSTNSPTIDRFNTTQDSGLQALPTQSRTDIQTGVPLNIPLPITQSSFTNQLSVDVRMLDGKPLVGWLRFDAATGSLIGQAPKGFDGKLQVLINVRDSKGNTSSSIMELHFNGQSGERGERDTKPVPVKDAKKPATHIMGKPGLNEQFAHYGKGAQQLETDALLSALSQLSVVPAKAQKA